MKVARRVGAAGTPPKDPDSAELAHPATQAQGYSLFMVEGHERFEELALQHVLGGLSSSDAAIFRAHLVECRECRLRVAELRDMAAELAATEREERRRSAVATQVARQEGTSKEPRSWLPWSSPRWALLAIVLASVVVAATLFWNFHLRRVAGHYERAVEYQTEVLEVLAAGEPLGVEGREGTQGIAAILGDGSKTRVAVDLRLPTVPDAHVAVWLSPPRTDGPEEVVPFPTNGQLPIVVEVGDADTLIVTLELDGSRPRLPGDRVLANVALRSGEGVSASQGDAADGGVR
ncbi:MAG: hypothetical protein M3252_01825 [Actinomycetota bacterium]|nr:hypothetical protein [Actinomycetota bacterium]